MDCGLIPQRSLVSSFEIRRDFSPWQGYHRPWSISRSNSNGGEHRETSLFLLYVAAIVYDKGHWTALTVRIRHLASYNNLRQQTLHNGRHGQFFQVMVLLSYPHKDNGAARFVRQCQGRSQFSIHGIEFRQQQSIHRPTRGTGK